jgi:hypothetical protein
MAMRRRPAPDADAAPKPITAKTLQYKDAQEALVRRMGAALIVLWDEAPDDLQDRLLDQAALMEDRDGPVTAADFEVFLRRVKAR